MTPRALFKGGLALALVLFVPASAAAQPQPTQHGFIVGLGGMTATDVQSPVFGVSAGFNVLPHLQITADVGRMQDVVANFTAQDLSLLDQGVNANSYSSERLASSVKVPANYFMGGVRLPFAIGQFARPYVALSAGVAHMSPAPTFQYIYAGTTVDITSDVMSVQRSGCAWMSSSACLGGAFREETRPMVSTGAGLAVTVKHVTVDFGYKYSGIFITSDYLQDLQGSPHNHTRINTHRFYAGAGFAF